MTFRKYLTWGIYIPCSILFSLPYHILWHLPIKFWCSFEASIVDRLCTLYILLYSTDQRKCTWVNVSRGRPADRTWPDISVSTDAGCPFCGRPAVTSACRCSTPVCAHAADHTRPFLVKQWSAASLIVALCLYLWVAYATSRCSGLDRRSYKVARSTSKLSRLWQLYRYLSTCSTSSASISTFVRIFVGFLLILSSNSTITPLGTRPWP